MAIRKVIPRSLDSTAASANLNFDAGTLFVDSTNNRIGIGNTTPDVKLQVSDTSDVGIAMSNSSSLTTGNRGSLAMFNSSNSTVGLIRFGAVTDNVGTDIQFYTRPAAGSLAQTMTLTSAGNLGLGTTNPQFKFHVRGADATSLFVVGNTTEDTRLEISTYQDDRIVLRANDSSNTARSIAFETGLTERMRIDSAGYLLVGQTSTIYGEANRGTLELNGGTNSLLALNIAGSATNGAYFLNSSTSFNTVVRDARFYAISVNSSERMRITSGGNVGLGIAPSAWFAQRVALQVSATVALSGSNAYYPYVGVLSNNVYYDSVDTPRYLNSSGATAFEFNAHANGNFAWQIAQAGTAGDTISFTQAMTLNSSGNLGIGVSNPLAKLHVKGTGTGGQVTASFILENGSSGTAGMDITGSAGASRLRFLYGGGPSTGTNALTQAMCILTEGSTAGNVGIGTSVPAHKLSLEGATNGTATFLATLIGTTHLAGSAIGIGFKPEAGSNARFKAALVFEGNGEGYDLGDFHFLQRRTFDQAPADLTNKVMTIKSAGQVLVGTTSTDGSVGNYGTVVAGLFKSFSGQTASTASGTYVTLFNASSGTIASYLVTVWISADDVNNYQANIIVNTQSGSSTKVSVIVAGNLLQFQMSGYSVQARQNSGGASTISWSAIRISA